MSVVGFTLGVPGVTVGPSLVGPGVEEGLSNDDGFVKASPGL
jgi:hypothetical protein